MLLALKKNNNFIAEWEMSKERVWGNRWTGFAVGGCRSQMRATAQTTSKAKD